MLRSQFQPPISGSTFESKQGPPIAKKNGTQVVKSCAWCNYLFETVAPSAKRILINLDETSVRYYYGDKNEDVFKAKRQESRLDKVRQNVSRKDLRACVTHAALIAEDPAVQQLLPQWILGNMNIMLDT
jgi:hypothetical protein